MEQKAAETDNHATHCPSVSPVSVSELGVSLCRNPVRKRRKPLVTYKARVKHASDTAASSVPKFNIVGAEHMERGDCMFYSMWNAVGAERARGISSIEPGCRPEDDFRRFVLWKTGLLKEVLKSGVDYDGPRVPLEFIDTTKEMKLIDKRGFTHADMLEFLRYRRREGIIQRYTWESFAIGRGGDRLNQLFFGQWHDGDSAVVFGMAPARDGRLVRMRRVVRDALVFNPKKRPNAIAQKHRVKNSCRLMVIEPANTQYGLSQQLEAYRHVSGVLCPARDGRKPPKAKPSMKKRLRAQQERLAADAVAPDAGLLVQVPPSDSAVPSGKKKKKPKARARAQWGVPHAVGVQFRMVLSADGVERLRGILVDPAKKVSKLLTVENLVESLVRVDNVYRCGIELPPK